MMYSVTRNDVFSTPLWTSTIDLSATDQLAIRRDADLMLEHGRATDRPFEQTGIIEPLADGPSWRRLFGTLEAAAEQVHTEAAFNRQPPNGPLAHTSWILRIRGESQFDEAGGVVDLLHAHHRNLLASVYYLTVPEELQMHAHGGTLLRSPIGPLASDFHEPNFYLPAAEGTAVFFPAAIEHAPSRPIGLPPFSTPRVVIVTNWRSVGLE